MDSDNKNLHDKLEQLFQGKDNPFEYDVNDEVFYVKDGFTVKYSEDGCTIDQVCAWGSDKCFIITIASAERINENEMKLCNLVEGHFEVYRRA